jgi:small subunit ribosomal protein S17
MENKQPTIKRRLEGTVVSDKMQKTRVIEVNSMRKHPKYLKYYKVSHRMKAHDEENQYKVGDQVVIEETRPLSREKRWTIISKRLTTND